MLCGRVSGDVGFRLCLAEISVAHSKDQKAVAGAKAEAARVLVPLGLDPNRPFRCDLDDSCRDWTVRNW